MKEIIEKLELEIGLSKNKAQKFRADAHDLNIKADTIILELSRLERVLDHAKRMKGGNTITINFDDPEQVKRAEERINSIMVKQIDDGPQPDRYSKKSPGTPFQVGKKCTE